MRLLRNLYNAFVVEYAKIQLKYRFGVDLDADDGPPPPPPPRTDEEHDAYIDQMDRVFTPGPHNEKPLGEFDHKSITNWARVDPPLQTAVMHLLAQEVPPHTKQHWADQVARGVSLGSDDNWFHFGIGMAIRNLFRKLVSDELLPPVQYPHGEESNWDDYYIGALYAYVQSTDS